MGIPQLPIPKISFIKFALVAAGLLLFVIVLNLLLIPFSCAKAANEVVTSPSGEKIIYKYKEYEKFDFEQLDVDADSGAQSDLSVTPREQLKFQNKLPLRKNFNPEIKRSLENTK